MTARKPRPTPQVVVEPEPYLLSTAELARRLLCSPSHVTRRLLFFADGTPATKNDVPKRLDGSEPQVFVDVGGGVMVPVFVGPNGAMACFRIKVEQAIDEAGSRSHHPAGTGR